ncbi:MAG: Gfo/Idh/MocA family oxidoreductase [Planctomycetia bacterium]|nr:Gfo/Idh/MocA family oxidoreductase [Planctomycetia bacterium]
MSLRLAFVGVDHPHGAHWRETLENFGERIEITALLPCFGGALTSLEERFAEVPRFATVDDLIARGDFDAALVALPNNEGPSTLLRLAEAGKHIFTEKPGAATAADLRPLVAAVRKHDVAFQSGFMWRYDACAERLRTMLAEKRFGKLIHIDMKFVTSDIRRRGPDHYLFDRNISGAGFINWLGCHHLDLLLYVAQRRVMGVTARLGTFGATATDVEDGGTVVLDLEGGALATFTGGYWFPRWAGENQWSIRGSERWVNWHPNKPGTSGALEIHGPQPQWHAMEETFSVAADTTPGYGGIRGVDVVGDWLAAIEDRAASRVRECRNTPESTVATLEILDAAYESSRSGRRVECSIGS